MTREERACRHFLKLIISTFQHVFHAGAYLGPLMLGIRAVDPDWRGIRFTSRVKARGSSRPIGITYRTAGAVHGIEVGAINSWRMTLRVVMHITSIEDAAI